MADAVYAAMQGGAGSRGTSPGRQPPFQQEQHHVQQRQQRQQRQHDHQPSPLLQGQTQQQQAPPQPQQQMMEVKQEMILDGRNQRFALQIPWASYCMLRPLASTAAAATETGRIVMSGAQSSTLANVLVPTVLHTLDTEQLPYSLTPRALNVSSLPPDCFVAYFFVVRLSDGRTVRCFHRYSAIRNFVLRMRRALSASGGLVEVGWFPWRRPQPQAMVNHDERRRRLEGYLSMLFQQNQALQTHPETFDFFLRSGASDLSVGVSAPPSSFPHNPTAALRRRKNREQPPQTLLGSIDGGATARLAMAPSRRLMTIVVDVDTGLGLAKPAVAADAAARALLEKLHGSSDAGNHAHVSAIGGGGGRVGFSRLGSGSSHGGGGGGGGGGGAGLDLSELRVVAIEGIAPQSVRRRVEATFVQELGQVRGRAAFASQPNLQLLRAFHFYDKAGEGLVTTFAVGTILGRLGVHLPPALASDLLLQSLVDGETLALWHQASSLSGNGNGGYGGDDRGAPQRRFVDYHTFLSLVLARTQQGFGDHTSAVARGDEQFQRRILQESGLAQTVPDGRHGDGNGGGGGGRVVVDVATGYPLEHSELGTAHFSVAVMLSTHAHGAVAAAIGSNGAGLLGGVDPAMAGLLGPGPGGGGGIGNVYGVDGMMPENSPAFMDFKNSGERGFNFTIHKIKWPKAAAALHRAVGLDATRTLDNTESGVGNLTVGGGGASSGQAGQKSGAGGMRGGALDVSKPFLVCRSRVVRLTDNYTKLVWFKQGLKGAVAKVGRAFNSNIVRPSDQPGAGTFDLLQVTKVRVVEDPHTPLGRWFVFSGGHSQVAPGTTHSGNGHQQQQQPLRSERFFALIGLTESLYVEVANKSERDRLVAGFRQLLFGAEGRARARAHAHGRAMQNGKASFFDANDDLRAIQSPSSSPLPRGNGGGGSAVYDNSEDVGANAEYVFRLFDTNNDGALDRREATKALIWAGFAGAEDDVESLFRRFDVNGDEQLSLREFADLMVACEHGDRSSDSRIMDTFRRFDTGGDGSLDEFQLGHALGSMGCVLSDQNLSRILASADRNHDGKLDYGEFSRIIKAAQQGNTLG